MLLRRFIKHFEEQNWTAIGLDFVIVVFGVFVGLQVNNWNTERANRLAEHQYLERLHAEVLESNNFREFISEQRRKNIPHFHAALEVLFSDAPPRELRVYECTSLTTSHLNAAPFPELPTVRELYSSGRFDALNSNEVKNAIRSYIQSIDSADGFLAFLMENPLSLAQKYPQYIVVNYLVRGDFGIGGGKTSTAMSCDVEGMRADQAFMNDLNDNANRFDFYMERVMEAPLGPARELHRVLDVELGIVHEEAAP